MSHSVFFVVVEKHVSFCFEARRCNKKSIKWSIKFESWWLFVVCTICSLWFIYYHPSLFHAKNKIMRWMLKQHFLEVSKSISSMNWLETVCINKYTRFFFLLLLFIYFFLQKRMITNLFAIYKYNIRLKRVLSL